MFKRKKKKTGCETPELRKPTPPPPPPMAIKDDFKIKGFEGRVYKLNNGDIFWLNDAYVQQAFKMSIKDLTLGEKIEPGFICLKKTKRRHWWQVWKKKYTGARFMYVGEENNKCKD